MTLRRASHSAAVRDSGEASRRIESEELALYEFGVRLGQASIIHTIAAGAASYRATIPAALILHERTLAAFTFLAAVCDFGENTASRVCNALQRAYAVVDQVAKHGDYESTSTDREVVSASLDSIAHLIEVWAGLKSRRIQAWFHLGRELVKVEPDRTFTHAPHAPPTLIQQSPWWPDRSNITSLLQQLDLTFDDVFVDPNHFDMANSCDPIDNVEGCQYWGHIEAGIHQLRHRCGQPVSDDAGLKIIAAGVSAKRKAGAFYRDHSWLRWNEQDGRTPGAIRDDWNRMPEDKRKLSGRSCWQTIGVDEHGIDTVKKALTKAKRERDQATRPE